MESEKYSPERLARLALSVLRKEKSISELVVEYDIPEWILTEALVKIVQGAYTLTGGTLGAARTLESFQQSDHAEGNRLCFIHLEKTAGTSLTSFLDDCYPIDEICPALLLGDLVDLATSKDLKQYNLLHGHFSLSWLNSAGLNFSNTKFITVLRHPLQRQISSYRHWMRVGPTAEYYSALLGGTNSQCMRLSPLPIRRGYASTRDHLDAAKQALEEFFFVGIQERFQESVAALSLLLGHPAATNVYSLNVSKNDIPDLPQLIQDEIVTANWADVELYDFAVALFERKFSHVALQDRRHEGSILTWTEMSEVKYRMDHALFGSGWHYREGKAGQTWRWSGPGTESVVSFHLDPTRQYRLSVRVINALTPEILESLQIYVNDEAIKTLVSTDGLQGQIYEGVVPRSALCKEAPNANVILRVCRTEQFNHVDPTSIDDRYCGVAVSEINFTPLDMDEFQARVQASPK